MRIRYATAAVMSLATLLSLAGCSALLGGGKPEQLYRFEAPPAGPLGAGSIEPPRSTLLVMPVRFAAEIQGDRVLASRSQEALYIKGLRWIAPAPILFEQSVRATFRARAPWLAVTERRGGGPADNILQIRVDRFEARYDGGPAAPPTIHVEGEATLSDAVKLNQTSRYRISSVQQAVGGNAAAIVAAFSQAAAMAVVATVDWTDTTVAPR